MKNVALVYDRLNKIGGAEQVLITLHQLFPKANWYTAVYNPVQAPYARSWSVTASFLQKIPFLPSHHELVPFLTPFAFESFSFDKYDLVITTTSAEAKGIITKPNTLHICYCLTPTRYLWSHADFYLTNSQLFLLKKLFFPLTKKLHSWLRNWDYIAAQRPDAIIAISRHVQRRIRQYYHRSSTVIYPPVDTRKFSRLLPPPPEKDYYLIVSRLVPYKNIDFVVKNFAHLPDKKLIIIGTGVSYRRLRRLSPPNVIFKGLLPEKEVIAYLQHAKAFIQANEEDFGIAMVEALASGTPVLAYQKGGALEILTPQTGLFFSKLSTSSFLSTFAKMETMSFNPHLLQQRARFFDKAKFKKQFLNFVEVAWQKHQNTLM